ncbi:hypothetical protein KAR91_50065 [Candidatus Pacearchaeota archaeon]|nr:hypothetical protein [Candidatus Pacearchaeota archaeon]
MPQESLPPKGLFVSAELQAEFEESIDQLVSDLGYKITLYFEPIASGCSNCSRGPDGASDGIYTDTDNPFTLGGQFNIAFPEGTQCPVCKGSNDILTESSQDYTALLKYNPEDIEFEPTGRDPTQVVRTKTQLVAINDIKRSVKVKIEGEFYALIREPIRTGLQSRSHVRAWWQKLQ